jgi:translation elongation factor EF-4
MRGIDVVQARVGRKVLARERISPYRKDVLTTKAGKNVRGHTDNP